MEFWNIRKSRFYRQFFHQFSCNLMYFMAESLSCLNIQNNCEKHTYNILIFELGNSFDNNFRDSEYRLKSFIIVIENSLIMSEKFDNIFDVLLKIFAVLKHESEHVKQYDCVFCTVSKFLLSKYWDHERNVIRTGDMAPDYFNDLIDKFVNIFQVKLRHSYQRFDEIFSVRCDQRLSQQQCVLQLSDSFEFSLWSVGKLKNFFDWLMLIKKYNADEFLQVAFN